MRLEYGYKIPPVSRYSTVLKISTEGVTEVMFDFFYKSATPSGITFLIADTERSNGNGGTDGFTPWHAEVQGRNGNMEIFMNSNDDVSLFEIMPEKRPYLIENLTNIVASYAHLSLTVKPDYFGWNDNRKDHEWDLNREGFIDIKYLFSIDGRSYIPNYGNGVEDKGMISQSRIKNIEKSSLSWDEPSGLSLRYSKYWSWSLPRLHHRAAEMQRC